MSRVESENRLFRIQRLEEEGISVCEIKKRTKEKLERKIENQADEPAQEEPVGVLDLWESIKETKTPFIIRGPDNEEPAQKTGEG